MTEVTKIFVVVGSQGEYSDRSVWTVRAFYSNEAAQEFIPEQERNDLIGHFVEQARTEFVSKKYGQWLTANPEPKYQKPVFDHKNPDQKEAQRLHKKALDDANVEYAPKHTEWWKKCTEEQDIFRAEAVTVITEDNVMAKVSSDQMSRWYDRPSYYIEEIPLQPIDISIESK
jgi:hypothetical protein